jgi:hypothetical protein
MPRFTSIKKPRNDLSYKGKSLSKRQREEERREIAAAIKLSRAAEAEEKLAALASAEVNNEKKSRKKQFPLQRNLPQDFKGKRDHLRQMRGSSLTT